MPDSVLIPTGNKMKSYGCMRSLGRRGIRTIVASERKRLPHFSSRYCSERVLLPSPPEDVIGYKDSLLEIARRSDVKTVFPIRECDVYIFAKYREEFEDHVSLVTPDFEALRTGQDRLRLAQAAQEAGVPFAETRLLSDVSEWDRDVVIKSRFNLLTGDYVESYPQDTIQEMKSVRFIEAGDEPDTETIRDEMRHEPIVQDFIPQAEKHLYCSLWDNGEPLATYQHRQIRQNSWVGGGGIYRESVFSQAVDDAAHDLLSHINWTGYACIEYVKDKETGEWKFLEINPRVWQSMPEAVRANADFPYYYWLRSQGYPELIDPDYDMGVFCHNAYGEVAHLLSVLRDDSPFIERPSFMKRFWEIASSSLLHPRFEYIRRDDPQLFLSAIRETLSAGVTRSREYSVGNAHLRPSPTKDAGNRQ